MDRMRALAALAIFFLAIPLHADAWSPASAGAIPPGAIAFGHEADGNQQYVCRGEYGGGLHLGKIASGLRGCHIAFGGREITLQSYEVFVRFEAREAMTMRSPVSMAAKRVVPSPTYRPPILEPVPPTPLDTTRKRGFDDKGEPYIDVTLPDGTIKRTQTNGVTLIKPDGTTQFIPLQVVFSHVQPPTPPELPDDPALGRGWMAFHNEALLDVIRMLVKNDEAEMKRFADREQNNAGSDVFKQIAYRTKIASLLAEDK